MRIIAPDLFRPRNRNYSQFGAIIRTELAGKIGDVGLHHGALLSLRLDASGPAAREKGHQMEQTRDRLKPIKVYVTPGERAAIDANAKACDLTVSAYLRTLGSGYEPKSTLDQQAVGDLVKVHAGQGRLGGLLKLWLTEKRGEGAPAYDVRSLLRQIEALQDQLRAIIKRL